MLFMVVIRSVCYWSSLSNSFFCVIPAHSHGYCIMSERLSLPEQCTTAALGCALYLTLVGYKAAVPYFTVLLLLNYFISFYVIFHHISQNLLELREQLSFIQDEDIQAMHEAIHTKYTMFKKFQGAMQMLAVAEILMHINLDAVAYNYWIRLLVREWAQFCIFMYIGYTFRSQEVSPRFSVMPLVKSKMERMFPPIYSIEMDAADFKSLAFHEWHIGVPTSVPSVNVKTSMDPLLVIVQHPHASNRDAFGSPARPKAVAAAAMTAIIDHFRQDSD